MHLGYSIGLAVQGRSSHPVLDSVRWYSGGITAGEAAICYPSDQSLDDGLAERRRGPACRLARAGAVALLSGRLVWTRGTMV